MRHGINRHPAPNTEMQWQQEDWDMPNLNTLLSCGGCGSVQMIRTIRTAIIGAYKRCDCGEKKWLFYEEVAQ